MTQTPRQQRPRLKFRNNFGAIRYILCFAIALSHFNVLTGSHLWFPITAYHRVCSFFVMSGFLIYGSYFRADNWKDYLRNRAWRILPSYLLTILLCALLLVFISDLPARDYFLSAHWWRYLISNAVSLNFIEPALPGVFTGHAEEAVNGSLWTMKVEWALYVLIIPVIIFTRKSGIPFWKVFLGILFFSIIYKFACGELYASTGRTIFRIMEKQFGGQLAYFYCGVALFVYFDKIKGYKEWLAVASLIVVIIGSVWLSESRLYSLLIFPLSISTLVVTLAFIGRWGIWAERFENCSYEIYLFHFPLTQVAVHHGLPERLGHLPTFLLIFATAAVTGYFVASRISAPLRRAHRRGRRPDLPASTPMLDAGPADNATVVEEKQ